MVRGWWSAIVLSFWWSILSKSPQQIFSANLLSRFSQQIFSASSQQIFSADHLLWSGVGGQLLSYHLPCHLLWSGVGGQLLSYHFGGLYCMSSTRCSIRENVAIARIGTSQIIGTCRIVDCKLVATRDLRTGNLVKAPGCPPDFEVKFQLKWHEMKDMMRNYNMIWAWIMEDPVRFECPLQFKRPKGAQIWFRLDKNGNETTSRSNSKNQKKPKRSQSPHVKTQKKRRLKSG